MTNLSNRGYPMLKTFATAKRDYYMSIEAAQAYDQRPFRSMLIRGWIKYRPGRGFHLTPDGKRAWNEFLMTDIIRKDPTQPLTAYFDAVAYGLAEPKKPKRVHVIHAA